MTDFEMNFEPDVSSSREAVPDHNTSLVFSNEVGALLERFSVCTSQNGTNSGDSLLGTVSIVDDESMYMVSCTDQPGQPSTTDAPKEEKVSREAKHDAVELERAKTYTQRFDAAGDPVAKSVVAFENLPAKFDVVTSKGEISISTNEFSKILESIPGAKLPFELKQLLDGTSKLGLTDGKLSLSGKSEIYIKEADATLVLDSPSGDLIVDAKKPGEISLRNIKNLKVRSKGAEFTLKDVKLSLSTADDGSKFVELTLGELKPVVQDNKKKTGADALFGKLQNGYNQLAGALVPEIPPRKIPVSEQSADRISKVIRTIEELKEKGKSGEANAIIDAVTGIDMSSQLGGLFDKLSGISRDGERIELKREAKEAFNFGGLPFELGESVSFKTDSTDGALRLHGIEGIKSRIPLPADVGTLLGLGKELELSVKEVSLSKPDEKGLRVATLKTDSLLESVSLKVDKDLKPVTDKAGNISIKAVLNKEGRVPVTIEINPNKLQQKGGPDFRLTVDGKVDESSKLIEAVFGQRLDADAKALLGTVESVSKVGDRVVVTRKENTTISKEGLSIKLGKTVDFKLDSRFPGLKLRDIRGVELSTLPKEANNIYKSRLPATIQSLTLSQPDKDGGRVLVFTADRAITYARASLDAGMNPKEIVADVENPVKLFLHNVMPGNFDNRADKKYQIIVRDNHVDVGGLRDVSDMIMNAGNFKSFEGAAAVGVGYAGRALTGDTTGATVDLGKKILNPRSWFP